jgi:hypothetical protein
MMGNLLCAIKGEPMESKVITSRYIERESVGFIGKQTF